ncbi:MAG TPA: hypothetical protein VNW99_02530 [Cytophagaceae bacterium]|jgi:hypothetical protein|nr:hypothetical protein [Cytophagaceae bacterium]
MSWKKGLMHALVSALLAGISCIIYNSIYSTAFYVNFNAVLNMGAIIGSCTLGCTLMATSYILAIKWKGDKLIPWVNIIISTLSFASIVGVLSFDLPLDVESPEMFPGLAIPMHFFPALSFFTVAPFFKIKIS